MTGRISRLSVLAVLALTIVTVLYAYSALLAASARDLAVYTGDLVLSAACFLLLFTFITLVVFPFTPTVAAVPTGAEGIWEARK